MGKGKPLSSFIINGLQVYFFQTAPLLCNISLHMIILFEKVAESIFPQGVRNDEIVTQVKNTILINPKGDGYIHEGRFTSHAH
jgi:hypothetical protein